MSTINKLLFSITVLFYGICLSYLLHLTDRNDSASLLLSYGGSFLAFLTLIYFFKQASFRWLCITAIFLGTIPLFFTPTLSNDYYRFLWDGEIFWSGLNPFDFSPLEIAQQHLIPFSTYTESLYDGMGELSRKNYSCYPPINQTYFAISTYFFDSIPRNLLVMRLLIFGTQVLGAWHILKILKLLKLPIHRIWILFLNPLFLIETIGNLHFEGVMLSFLAIAFYYTFTKKWLLGALFFALSIHIKLIPFMFLPFFLRYFEWRKTVLFYSSVGIMVLLFGVTQINPSNYLHFIKSLLLYFKVFEFNSSLLYIYIEYGQWKYHWNLTNKYAPILSMQALKAILIFAWYGMMDSELKLFRRLTMAFFVYLALSSTIHPWYIITLLFLTLFTHFRFALVWSGTIFLSYFLYNPIYKEYHSILLMIEYLPVYALFTYEILRLFTSRKENSIITT